MEVSLEVGDLRDLGVEGLLVLGTRANDSDEVRGAIVVTGVQAADSMVLVLAHVLQVVAVLVQPVPLEEPKVEGAFRHHSFPVGSRLINVDAHALTIAHCVDELSAHIVANTSVSLLAQCLLDNLVGEGCKLALVLHKGANIALLVPDEDVLVGLEAGVADGLELTKSLGGPGVMGDVSFNHSD